MKGNIDGIIEINGSLHAPIISAPLNVFGLEAYGLSLGNGAVTVTLRQEPLFERNEQDLVLAISGRLSTLGSNIQGRSALALNKKTVNVDVQVSNLEVSTDALGVDNQYSKIIGKVSGVFIAKGDLNSPHLDASIIAHEYSFYDPRTRKGASIHKKLRGPTMIFAKSRNGILDVDVCASFLEKTSESQCSANSSLLMKLSGPFAWDEFSLGLKGSLDYAHMEDIVFALKNELIRVSSAARFTGQLKRAEELPFHIDWTLMCRDF